MPTVCDTLAIQCARLTTVAVVLHGVDPVKSDTRRVETGCTPGVSDSPAENGDARCCTTRSGNAHKTDKAEERGVLYPWHPWVGCVVLVHEVIEKADGVVLRCSRDGEATGRWLELPSACGEDRRVGYSVGLSCGGALLAALVGDDLL